MDTRALRRVVTLCAAVDARRHADVDGVSQRLTRAWLYGPQRPPSTSPETLRLPTELRSDACPVPCGHCASPRRDWEYTVTAQRLRRETFRVGIGVDLFSMTGDR